MPILLARSASHLLLVAALGMLAVGCASMRIESQDWLEARSQHFTIFSDLGREETRALSLDLEFFRAAMAHFTNAKRLDPPIPIEIYVFRRYRDFGRITGEDGFAGFFSGTPRRLVLVVDSTGTWSARKTLFHEYVHFLMRNARDVPIPRWYDEGFADFMSTLERRADSLVLGGIPRGRGLWLMRRGRLPVSAILEPAPFADYSEDEIGRFYAGAWLLVHFLVSQYQDPDDLSFGERMNRYLEAYQSGTPSGEAFEIAWGLPLDRLEEMIDEPIQSGFRKAILSLDSIRFEEDVVIRAMDQPEIAFRLGELALSSGRTEVARSLLEVARSADPEQARVLAALGRAAAAAGRSEEAAALLDRAVELEPDDVPILLDRARFWLARIDEMPDAAERAAARATARRDSRRAFEQQPDHPEVLWIYALSHLSSERATKEELHPWAAVLERARQILPADRGISYSLFEVYLVLGRREEAERIAQRLLLHAHGREQIEKIEAKLERAARE